MPCEWQDITGWPLSPSVRERRARLGLGDYAWVCTETSKIYDEFPNEEDNLAACLAECGGPPPPTPIRTELTCFATPDVVKVGETTNVYGILRGADTGVGIPNQPVRLYRKKPGEVRFSYVRYVRSDGSGGYMFKDQSIDREGQWQFYTYFEGTDTVLATVSPTVIVDAYTVPPVRIRTSLTLQADREVIPSPPGTVTFTGRLSRRDTGEGLSKIIDLYQQKPGGVFQSIAKISTAYATGEYSYARELVEPGAHSFYAGFDGDITFEDSKSATVSVGVEETPPGPPEPAIPYSTVITVSSILAGIGLIGLSRG